jgi:hypothetical protein
MMRLERPNFEMDQRCRFDAGLPQMLREAPFSGRYTGYLAG